MRDILYLRLYVSERVNEVDVHTYVYTRIYINSYINIYARSSILNGEKSARILHNRNFLHCFMKEETRVQINGDRDEAGGN